ncbi:MAG: hypothetical protein H0T65_05380 [Deltaproteobacteria bacterium]|nr:hypothetical protein [Deltaproteobacteria bacterium]
MKRALDFLRERTSATGTLEITGGASFAYVFGKVLVFLLVVQGATGAALAAFYSPSSTDAGPRSRTSRIRRRWAGSSPGCTITEALRSS